MKCFDFCYPGLKKKTKNISSNITIVNCEGKFYIPESLKGIFFFTKFLFLHLDDFVGGGKVCE